MKRTTLFYKLSLSLIVLIAALVWISPTQPVLAAAGIATFSFTSSPNPSGYHTDATFTLAATGDQQMQPLGYVDFYDGTTLISGCHMVRLNLAQNSFYDPNVPAVCTTSNLAPGTHTITAYFNSLMSDDYDDATVTLEGGHTVNVTVLTIGPDALPEAMWGASYTQQLTVTPGDGSYEWTWTGNSPEGINLWGYTGELEGAPTEVGEFRFTVMVEDYAGGVGTKDYVLTVRKATPQITVADASVISGDSIYLDAEVRHPAPYSDWAQPGGSVSFSVDGTPVPGCSGNAAVQIDAWQYASCQSYAATGLSGGDHTIKAEYLPDEASSAHYVAASGMGTLHVMSTISGVVFNDLDQDGTKDAGEEILTFIQVNLDEGCDGSDEDFHYPDWETGEFFFTGTSGVEYCVKAQTEGNWRQTTSVEPFTLDGDKVLTIGLYLRQLTVSPEGELAGEVGVEFSKVITVSGGKAPFTFDISPEIAMPSGVNYAVDESAGTITFSGTPTTGGLFAFSFDVTDAEALSTSGWNYLLIMANGNFSLTSTPNPSETGQAVTFTLSATGEAVYPEYGTIPPVGNVTFYDGDSALDGCAELLLNYKPNAEPQFGDYPVVCTTSALSDGTHTIKAAFTPITSYHDAIVTLEQQVESPSPTTSADLKLTKVDSKDPIKAGGSLAYTLKLRNLGPNEAESVKVIDTLDSNTTFVSFTAPKGWTCAHDAGVVTCTKARLASDGTANIVVNLKVKKSTDAGTILINSAEVSSATYDPNMANNDIKEQTRVAK